MQYISLNYKISETKDLKLSFENRGFLFGDGFFETIKVNNNKIFNFKIHSKRIKKSLNLLCLDFDFCEEKIKNNVLSLTKKNKITSASVKLVFFRSSEGRYFPKTNNCSILVSCKKDKPNFCLNDVRINTFDDIKKSINFLSSLKSLNSLTYVMSAISAKKLGYDEAIIFNEQNFAIETTSSNLFFALNNKLFTPHLNQGCVEGTMRELIINNFNVKEIKVKMDDLINSHEIVLTNSLSIKSVTEINGVSLNNSQYANRFLEKINQLI
tara:strand:+ start:11870 stop:12673 length:804 start_codon:yes stop_codon:yes gene_type:complete